MSLKTTVVAYSRFTDFDVSLFKSGKHYNLYEKFGSHAMTVDDVDGTYFAVWAPNAQYVSVIGEFNNWKAKAHQLNGRWDGSGIWEGFIPGVTIGASYKYRIKTYKGEKLDKADPYALQMEKPPHNASVVNTTWYKWKDKEWMANRMEKNSLRQPMSVYELHLGSWIRDPENPKVKLNYLQVAEKLVPYILDMGFTHVELMPVMHHPYYPSWGYQITGYFAASSFYGSPQDLMSLIEQLHLAGIGVILDWVPSHFPGDPHGLHYFDGTHLYEHEDPRKGYHPDWNSWIFNYGRPEVKSFLISNAHFWIERYHADGLRIDAVASMLHLDYSRKAGEWVPNIHGGRENLEAITFMQELNTSVYGAFPDVQTIAEDSTSWEGVTRPVSAGGLGFGLKWMMGWMHDTLDYFEQDTFFRKFHHNLVTFGLTYAFGENYMLPFSHDEVVHGKASMIYKMPGDEWQKFANLRLLYLFMFTHPGSKLLFMGSEFAQTNEWNFLSSLDWHLLEFEPHKKMQDFVRQLNHLYRNQLALYEFNYDWRGFEWIEANDGDNSVFAYLRKGSQPDADLIIVLNMTPIVRQSYRIGLPDDGSWQCLLNSDDDQYYGSGVGAGLLHTQAIASQGRPYSLGLALPPLAGVVLGRAQVKKGAPKAKKAAAKKQAKR
ncbi:MAG: 1,4-alpha-glucan branching protein GlgB [Edaphocola sp.]